MGGRSTRPPRLPPPDQSARKGASAGSAGAPFHARPLLVPSYFAASCGGAPLSIIRQYIEQQRRPT
ncbi:hypothetical protein EDD27_5045 [Nonomuraea polychroma]|uniref:Transposase IS200 family protein n=1 Tax=Nonomuraea polychroma TaxID=46176 RepID=A0A438M9P0_9ACTN|nr:hypothetical protein EDD27_5045 [Nonomuraea polychroma]